MNLVEARKITRQEFCNGSESPVSNQQTNSAAGEREDRALGEQLAHHTPARRAERSAYRHLFLTRSTARKQKVCDVRATYQQHERDGAKQQPQEFVRLANQVVVH